MRRKTIAVLLVAFTLLAYMPALAEERQPELGVLPSLVRPGKTVHISFIVPQEGRVKLYVSDLQDQPLAVIQDNVEAAAGQNSFFWGGTLQDGALLQPGEYLLKLQTDAGEARQPLHVGMVSPQLNMLRVSHPQIRPGEEWFISAFTNMAGNLRLSLVGDGGENVTMLDAQVPQGELRIPWDGRLGGQQVPPGRRSLSLSLTDKEGFSSNIYHLIVDILAEEAAEEQAPPDLPPAPAEAAPAETMEGDVLPQENPGEEPPADEGSDAEAPQEDDSGEEQDAAPATDAASHDHYKIPSLEAVDQADIGGSYWTLPVGKWDEEKIWQIMQQPMTVLEGRDQRETYKLRKEPDKSTKRENIVGEITYVSQGVHVLETLDNGWTLVEAFNSSYGPKNRNRRGYGDTDEIIRGYVETSVLKVKTPREDYGILIDKLKQELYVFKEGKLFTTLIVSTGQPTKQQPWNETPAGEFLMVSKVGQFNTGNLVCRMAMRINGGALIHEVPYILNENTGYWDYSIQERALGEKASHGCIRVQRKNNEDGVNMTWLWENIKVNTKVLVWDDTNRYYEYPPDDLQLYYNPDRGQYYHSNQNCPSIRNVFLPLKGSMLYSELDDPAYQKLTPCRTCNPPERKSKIDELNRANGY